MLRRDLIAGAAAASLSCLAACDASKKKTSAPSDPGQRSDGEFKASLPPAARKFSYGWNPDPTPESEKNYAFTTTPTPEARIDYRPAFPPAFQQGHIGSCVANAVAALVQYIRRRDAKTPDFVPSRLFFYYYGRALREKREELLGRQNVDRIDYDYGLMFGDTIYAIQEFGVCPEELWPYDDTPADENTLRWPDKAKPTLLPSKIALTQAQLHKAVPGAPMHIPQDLQTMKAVLKEGNPFVLGMNLYPSFYDGQGTPRVYIDPPSGGERSGKSGGHGVLIVGYDDSLKRFIVRNSWGPEVQDKGYFYLSYDYVLDPQLVEAQSLYTPGQIISQYKRDEMTNFKPIV